MELIKLVIKLRDHLLDVGALLLLIDLLEDGHLDVLLTEQTLLHERVEGFLGKHVPDLGVLVASEHLAVSLVDLGDEVGVNDHLRGWRNTRHTTILLLLSMRQLGNILLETIRTVT